MLNTWLYVNRIRENTVGITKGFTSLVNSLVSLCRFHLFIPNHKCSDWIFERSGCQYFMCYFRPLPGSVYPHRPPTPVNVSPQCHQSILVVNNTEKVFLPPFKLSPLPSSCLVLWMTIQEICRINWPCCCSSSNTTRCTLGFQGVSVLNYATNWCGTRQCTCVALCSQYLYRSVKTISVITIGYSISLKDVDFTVIVRAFDDLSLKKVVCMESLTVISAAIEAETWTSSFYVPHMPTPCQVFHALSTQTNSRSITTQKHSSYWHVKNTRLKMLTEIKSKMS